MYWRYVESQDKFTAGKDIQLIAATAVKVTTSTTKYIGVSIHATQPIVTPTTKQMILTTTTDEKIAASQTIDVVVALTTDENISASTADDRVGFPRMTVIVMPVICSSSTCGCHSCDCKERNQNQSRNCTPHFLSFRLFYELISEPIEEISPRGFLGTQKGKPQMGPSFEISPWAFISV
jgi:hypothetical protein